MRLLALFCVVLFITLASCQTRVDIFNVDSFDQGTAGIVILVNSTDTFPIVRSNFSQGSTANIIGGERDLQLTALTGSVGRTFSTSVIISTNGTGQWEISDPNGATSSILMQYDGVDGTMNLNTNGLGGVDLTASGQGDSFHVIIETDVTTTFTFKVYDQAGQICTRNITIPSGNVPVDEYLVFSSFTGGCDFENVGAIEVVVAGNANVDCITEVFAVAGIPSSATPSTSRTPSNSRGPPSSSRSPAASNSNVASRSNSRTPIAPSESRTPSVSPSASPVTTCQCDCPHFRCGLVFDRPGDDDDGSVSYDARGVQYRPVFYYAQDDDFANIHGDDGLETFVVLGGEVGKFQYGVDDNAVYLYQSGAASIKFSLSLILLSLLFLLF